MSSTGKLAGKVALVTGGSRGLGRGIAEGFAAEGANVVVNYLKDEKAANAVVDAIRKHGADAIAIRANIGDVDDVTRMVEAAVKKFGTIDILVNNAGMLNSCKLADMSVETWDDMIRVHLRGMFLCTRFTIPHMLKQKSGKVINMSGTFGVTGGAEFTHMSAAKAGMIGFTRALAREVGHDGINVNCIAPAIIRTDLYNFHAGGSARLYRRRLPARPRGRSRGRRCHGAVPRHQGRRLFHRADALSGWRRRHGLILSKR